MDSLKKMTATPSIPLLIIRACVIGACILPCFIFDGLPLSSIYPYAFYRVIFFQVLVAIMLFSWILLVLRDRSYLVSFRNPIVKSLLVFLVIFTISQIFSIDPWLVFWGTRDHMTGVVTYWIIFVWFYIVLSTHRKISDFRYIPIALSIIAFILTIRTYTNWVQAGTNVRALGLFGNALHSSAAYMLIGLTILSGFWINKSRNTRILLALGCISMVYCIILAGSRSTFWGLMLGVICMGLGAIYYWFRTKGRKMQYQMIFAIIGFMVLSGVGIHYLSGRTNSMSHLFSTFAADRFELWEIGLGAFVQKPWFGWGSGQFIVPFSRLYDGAIFPHVPGEWYSEVHNNFFDFAISGGVFTASALFVFWCVVLVVLLRHIKGERNKMKFFLGVTFIACFIAELFQDMFFFYTYFQLVFLFLILAFSTRYVIGETHAQERLVRKKIAIPTIMSGAVVSMGMIVWLCIIPSLHEYIGMEYRTQVLNHRLQDAKQTLETLRKIPSIYEDQAMIEFSMDVLSSYMTYGLDVQDAKDLMHTSAEIVRGVIQRHPLQVDLYSIAIPLIANDPLSPTEEEARALLAHFYTLMPKSYNSSFVKLYTSLGLKDYDGIKDAINEMNYYNLPAYFRGQSEHYDAAYYASRGEYEMSFEKAYEGYSKGYTVFDDVALIDALALGTTTHGVKGMPEDLASYVDQFMRQTNSYLPHAYEKGYIFFLNMGDTQRADALLGALETFDKERSDRLRALTESEVK